MIEILNQSAFFAVVLSLMAYFLALEVKKRLNHPLCNPLLLAILMVIGFLLLTGIPYDTYSKSGGYLSYLLTPATVALAIPLYQQFNQFRQHWRPVMMGIFSGVLCNLVVIYAMALYFGLDYEMYVTLLPKSITTAIGLGIAEEYGGLVSITATSIIITGIFGNICAESLCKLCKIRHPVAKGVAIGTASHAVGTSKAMEMGEVEGAMSSLSIVLTGLCTLLGISVFAGLY